MTDRADDIEDFLKKCGWLDATRRQIAGDASNRKYDRLVNAQGQTAILMDAPPETGEDVRPFVKIASYLRSVGLSAPEIYYQDETRGLLLIEDFGDALFADLMANDQSQEQPLYRAAADVLLHLHRNIPPELPVCDANWLTEMIAPLFEWYTPNPEALSAFGEMFRPYAERAAKGDKVLILRDYHAQNLLLLPDRPGVSAVGLLDFQDAILGHPTYDLVSILQDARRDVGPDVEAAIMNHMLDSLDEQKTDFRAAYAILGLQRNLRILGIFARLCLRDGKAHYVDMIPRVWGYVQRNLEHPDLAQLARYLNANVPVPTPPFLEQMKSQCPTPPSL